MTLTKLQAAATENAVNKGFYDDPNTLLLCVKHGAVALGLDPRPVIAYAEHTLRLAAYMRIVTEIGEAAEADRNGNPESTAIPAFSHRAEELADAVIRILDWSGREGEDLEGAVIAKMAYNSQRPRKHGKIS